MLLIPEDKVAYASPIRGCLRENSDGRWLAIQSGYSRRYIPKSPGTQGRLGTDGNLDSPISTDTVHRRAGALITRLLCGKKKKKAVSRSTEKVAL
jgi:hypothetical protein